MANNGGVWLRVNVQWISIISSLFNDASAGDKSAKALGVGEGVSGADWPSAAPPREWSRYARLALLDLAVRALDKTDTVGQVRTDINLNNILLICINGFIITWILHQIIMYSNKVKLVAG